MITLAYGGFGGLSEQDAWNIAFPMLLWWWCVVQALIYLACSVFVEHITHRVIAIGVYVFLVFLSLPLYGRSGEYGPGHVADDIGKWSLLIFFCLFISKVLWLYLCSAVTKRGVRPNDEPLSRYQK